jgi:hypothetical protein
MFERPPSGHHIHDLTTATDTHKRRQFNPCRCRCRDGEALEMEGQRDEDDEGVAAL